DTTGTLSISERIAQELERAKQAAEETSDQEKNTPEGNSETPGNSILPKEEEKRDEFTPQVDGLSVLQRQTSTGALRPKATPIRERFTGAIEVNGRKFVVRDVYAALSSNRQVIVLNIYDEPLSPQRRSAFHSNFRAALEDTAPILRFKLLFSSYGSGCHDGALKKYIIDVNAKKAALRYKKRFFSFSRGGNQILTKEFVLFDCKRKPGGFLSAELRGTAGFLIGGVRIPVIWNTDAVIQFPDKA
ncbi:hypothetical protein MRY87_13140, partial [bacterium]|nr:hypothetical protein [bacterium]